VNVPRGRYALPPLTALLVFESAARRQSFKAAASELAVTPGAVSHQMKLLERELGTLLFARLHRGVELTADGKLLFDALEAGFSGMATAIARIRTDARRLQVTIGSTTAVSSLWLTPRLTRFWKAHPDVAVNQHVSDNPDAGFAPIELRIAYGAPEEGTCAHSIELFRDELVPVCSPAFAAEHGDATLDALATLPLMHLESRFTNWTRWREWFEALGYRGNINESRFLNNYTIALQSARDDGGIVLGWKRLVSPLLERGVLTVFGQHALPAPHAFHLVAAGEPVAGSATSLLHDWLKESADNESRASDIDSVG